MVTKIPGDHHGPVVRASPLRNLDTRTKIAGYTNAVLFERKLTRR